MIGDMILKIRKEKNITKTELAKLTGLNIGHLTHIEKGERNPSHKALKNICTALKIPYQQLMYTYDITLSETQSNYGIINYIPYNKILSIDNINSLMDCPEHISSSSIAIKINDDTMEPLIKKSDYVFLEFNTPLESKELGLFSLNNNLLIRKLIFKKDTMVLRAENKNYKDIEISKTDKFYIIGKISI